MHKKSSFPRKMVNYSLAVAVGVLAVGCSSSTAKTAPSGSSAGTATTAPSGSSAGTATTAPSGSSGGSATAAASGSAGGSSAASGGGKAVSKLVYIVKFGTVPYFVAENKGIQSESSKLGITTTHIDVEQDSNAALSAVDTSIGQGAQGIITVVPDQKIGPAVLAKAKAANVPVIAIDDPIVDSAGNPAPFVGFDAASLGTQVGTEIASLLTKDGISASDVKIASIEDQKTPVCMTRNEAAMAALEKNMPSITASNELHIPYSNDLNSALTAMNTVATSHPTVKIWAIFSCNDAGVLGSGRALVSHGVSAANIYGVGLGGDYACQEFTGTPSGVRASYYLDSTSYGETAVKEMYDFLHSGTPIPAKTVLPGTLITSANYKQVAGC